MKAPENYIEKKAVVELSGHDVSGKREGVIAANKDKEYMEVVNFLHNWGCTRSIASYINS
ncbi:hypothetical protein [Serratia plymuthica]|uniref:hypothetical protein n=1 Tax=Serratia plymuthica TaxID=82996 RepID=UPI0007EAA06C|nr:hypothetical protein [Serratia plymuthica]ANJ99047.1 hypothetical protein ADP73_14260 [Serratia plymuthica]